MAAPKLIDNRLTTFRIESKIPQWRLWLFVTLWLGVVLAGAEQYLHWYTIHHIIPLDTERDRFGVVHQSTDFTCVPAALTTLFWQQGQKIDQREITDRLGTTVFGTYPWNIPRVGRHFGFQVTREHLDFAALAASTDPLLIHNRFSEGLHVSYIPPGRISEGLQRRVFTHARGPILPVMDPVDGLVLLDAEGFADYFDGDGAKEVYRFVHSTNPAIPYDVDAALHSGHLPLLKIHEGAWGTGVRDE